MINSPATNARGDRPPKDVPKTRRCLRCIAVFHSDWAGERICTQCKNTAAWRNGAPARSFPPNNRR